MRVTHPPVAVAYAATPEDDMFDSVRTAAQLNIGGPGLRKKATGVRPWLLLDSTGQAQIIEAGKHAIMRRTGLPARDLRILDPILSYPSTVLGRERAIVINLEHIKAIITAQEVLLLNSKDPSVTPFVDELQRRILRHHHATSMEERVDGDTDWTHLYDLGDPRSRDVSPTRVATNIPESGHEVKTDGKHSFDRRDGPKLLPFEFVALEACLEAACGSLDNEARTLEQEAHPALDKLTSKISTLNFGTCRKIKCRLVAITGTLYKDDDGISVNCYLTDKLEQQLDILPLLLLMVTLNKLSTLGNSGMDTEDYINIMLDDKQNHLLQMGVMLTTSNSGVSAFVCRCWSVWDEYLYRQKNEVVVDLYGNGCGCLGRWTGGVIIEDGGLREERRRFQSEALTEGCACPWPHLPIFESLVTEKTTHVA
ncbi:magnesium transporter MRS2-3-like protein [Tanacetum coccineum]